jgi:curved DNA-binding protein CbpA
VPRGEQALEEDVPKPVTGVDLRSLPIGPQEAFVMSRVDGRAGAAQIALETGLDVATVRHALARLVEVGAVTLRGQVSSPRPIAEPEIRHLGDAPPPYDPAELDVPAEMPPERKKEILDLFHRLDELDHYAVLGIQRDVERQTVKAAYFGRVAVFHPDKYFGRDIGVFKTKVEVIFRRITEAHDTLSKKKSRADYDAYLASLQATGRLGGAATSSPDHLARLAEVQRQIDQDALRAAARASEPAMGAVVVPEAPPSPAPPRSDSSVSGARRISPAPPSAEDRKRMAARHFGGSIPPAVSTAPASPSEGQRLAAAQIKERYESQVLGAAQSRVERFISLATEAEKSGDPVSAANNLRMAAALAPENEELARRLEDAETTAAQRLAGKYLEQAGYEEQNRRFTEAAATLERALRGRPSDAALHARTASCYLLGGKDSKRAAQLAKRAVELAPNHASYRTVLARIYASAGMFQSALAELERARTLAPGDDTIKQLIKQIRRGDG